MISCFRSSDFQISGSAISSHKNIQDGIDLSDFFVSYEIRQAVYKFSEKTITRNNIYKYLRELQKSSEDAIYNSYADAIIKEEIIRPAAERTIYSTEVIPTSVIDELLKDF